MDVSCSSPSVRRCSRGGIPCRLFEHRELNVGPESPCAAAGFGLFSSAFVTRDACRCRARQNKKSRRKGPGKLKVAVTRLSREVGRLIKVDLVAISNYAVTSVYEILGKVSLKRFACCAREPQACTPVYCGVRQSQFFRSRGSTTGTLRAANLQWLRQVCSVRSQSTPAGVLTVCAIKPTLGSATSAGPSGSYTRYS